MTASQEGHVNNKDLTPLTPLVPVPKMQANNLTAYNCISS